MSDSKKIYEKAVTCFHEGDIEKAKKYCEEAIAINTKNAAALNLKGLLLYINGDMNGAKVNWDINKKFNDDEVAKSYLKGLQGDVTRLQAYEEAQLLIKQLKITEAMECLDQCAESDFNSINVNNALSYCYFKKGSFTKSFEYSKKVLSVDKKNEVAKKQIKFLKDSGAIDGKTKNEKNKKKSKILVCTALSVVIIGIVTVKTLSTKTTSLLSNNETNSSNQEEGTENIDSNDKDNKEENEKDINDKKEEVKQENKFDSKIVDKLVEENDYDNLSELIKDIDRTKLPLEDTSSYDRAYNLMEEKGLEKFYNRGLEAFKSENFGKANIEFSKAYNYAQDSYLNPHIMYLLAVSYEKLGNAEEAIKYFEQFDRKIDRGDYVEETLYELSILYQKIDLTKSKKYAQKLKDKYPNSIYNNDSLKQILNSN